MWVSTYPSILIYSAGVGWGEGIKGWCNSGMVGLMRWKKRSQSLTECWISQLCLLLSLASRYTLGHCTHCTKSLSGLWTKTVLSQRLSRLQKTFERDKQEAATGRTVRSGTALMNDFYGLVESSEKLHKWKSRWSFLATALSHPIIFCFCRAWFKSESPVSENGTIQEKMWVRLSNWDLSVQCLPVYFPGFSHVLISISIVLLCCKARTLKHWNMGIHTYIHIIANTWKIPANLFGQMSQFKYHISPYHHHLPCPDLTPCTIQP